MALAEMAFAVALQGTGALAEVPCDADAAIDFVLLFSESPTRFVVEVTPECFDELAALWEGLPFSRLGEVTTGTSDHGEDSPRLGLCRTGRLARDRRPGKPAQVRLASSWPAGRVWSGYAELRLLGLRRIGRSFAVIKSFIAPHEFEGHMMLRFVTFVDGSNLDGVLKHLNLRVDDYGPLSPRSSRASSTGANVCRSAPNGRPPSIPASTGTRVGKMTNGPERSQGRGAAADGFEDESAKRATPISRTASCRSSDPTEDRGSRKPGISASETREWYESSAGPSTSSGRLRSPGRD